MAAIITIFRPDGSKERRPVGYGGGLCDRATEPYEARDVGSVVKRETAEALEDEAVRTAEKNKTRESR